MMGERVEFYDVEARLPEKYSKAFGNRTGKMEEECFSALKIYLDSVLVFHKVYRSRYFYLKEKDFGFPKEILEAVEKWSKGWRRSFILMGFKGKPNIWYSLEMTLELYYSIAKKLSCMLSKIIGKEYSKIYRALNELSEVHERIVTKCLFEKYDKVPFSFYFAELYS